MRDYWRDGRHYRRPMLQVSVVGFLDEGLLELLRYHYASKLDVSVVGFLDEGLLV
ncbi:TPA: hypothetical protein I8Z80_003020 [Legionella pneumophila]|nr:hypothetical protein [Legionella pneumophila]